MSTNEEGATPLKKTDEKPATPRKKATKDTRNPLLRNLLMKMMF